MAYDKKTGTINIGNSDTPKDFEQDLFKHFAHIEEQIAKDFPQTKKPAPKPIKDGFLDKLQNLSKPAKGGIAFIVFWTAYVIYRTSGYHEVLGHELSRWNDEEFLTNWLGFPVVVGAIYFTVRWVMKDKQKFQSKSNPLTDFERELDNWPAHQAKIALLLIKATIVGNQEAIEKLHGELTVEQFKKVVAVIKKMQK